jgi:beta-lactamase superfamily II metal-dependent hydrolase
MTIVKSFSVEDGDMFYIKHGSDNFTIIDCCLSDDNKEKIVNELKKEKKGKNITRFISTHPDEDHILNLDYLDDEIEILNFYCVNNKAKKDDETSGFKRYCELRDSNKKAFYISKGCSRKWMNIGDDERGSSGINIMWPDLGNQDFKDELTKANDEGTPNNISPIFKYSVNKGATILWMGDLENNFMEKIKDKISFSKVNILFAPHHGRKSGKIPKEWLKQMNPNIIIMGEAPSENLDYATYDDYNKITQNSAGDIIFECDGNQVHIYVSKEEYTVNFLENKNKSSFDNYIGSLVLDE